MMDLKPGDSLVFHYSGVCLRSVGGGEVGAGLCIGGMLCSAPLALQNLALCCCLPASQVSCCYMHRVDSLSPPLLLPLLLTLLCAGHGSQQRDYSGEESDGECMCHSEWGTRAFCVFLPSGQLEFGQRGACCSTA